MAVAGAPYGMTLVNLFVRENPWAEKELSELGARGEFAMIGLSKSGNLKIWENGSPGSQRVVGKMNVTDALVDALGGIPAPKDASTATMTLSEFEEVAAAFPSLEKERGRMTGDVLSLKVERGIAYVKKKKGAKKERWIVSEPLNKEKGFVSFVKEAVAKGESLSEALAKTVEPRKEAFAAFAAESAERIAEALGDVGVMKTKTSGPWARAWIENVKYGARETAYEANFAIEEFDEGKVLSGVREAAAKLTKTENFIDETRAVKAFSSKVAQAAAEKAAKRKRVKSVAVRSGYFTIVAADGNSFDAPRYEPGAEARRVVSEIRKKDRQGKAVVIGPNAKTLASLVRTEAAEYLKRVETAGAAPSKKMTGDALRVLSETILNDVRIWDADPEWVCGRKQFAFHDVEKSAKFDLSNGRIKVEYALGTASVDADGKVRTTRDEKTSAALKETTKKTYAKAVAAATEIVREAKKRGVEFRPTYRLEGTRGAIHGEAAGAFSFGGSVVDGAWTGPSYDDGLSEWKKSLSRWVKENADAVMKLEREKTEAAAERLGELVESYVARDVAEFVIANERYVTANAVVANLRGLKQTFHGEIRDTEASGRYAAARSEDVESAIELLVRKKILWKKELKGTYGYFDVLKTEKEAKVMASAAPKAKPWKEVAAKLKTSAVLTDAEADAAFAKLSSKAAPKAADFVDMLALAKSVGFYCVRQKEYLAAMAKAPDEFWILLKMKKQVETDPYLKRAYAAIEKAKKESDA